MAKSKKKKLDKRLARSLTLIVVIVVITCGSVFGYVVYRAQQSDKAPQDATQTFLNALQTNSYADAYDQLCASTKSQFTEDRFTTFAKAQSGIVSHTPTKTDIRSVNGVTSAIVTESILHSGGTHETRQIILLKSGTQWNVCGQPY
jgi:hypothetical protein